MQLSLAYDTYLLSESSLIDQFLAQGSAPGVRGDEEAEEELIVSLGMKVEGEQYMNGQKEGKGDGGNVGDRCGHTVIGAHGIARMKNPP